MFTILSLALVASRVSKLIMKAETQIKLNLMF